MNESYYQERQFVINRLAGELVHLEKQIDDIKNYDENREYTALMRTYLATQKEYLKLCLEADAEAEEADPLTAFTGQQAL